MPSWRPAGNPWLIAVVVTLAAFMEVLDTTIVNVALPHIAGTLSVSYDEATWALTSYLVSNSIVLPISAFFGRLLGRKRYFVICIVAFTVCSFLCGIATNLCELIVFRILQGFFGGGLQPNQQSIILDTFPPSQRGRAFSLTAIATVVAPVLGPTVGGWITDNYSWRWVFFINVPIGMLATFAVISLVEDPPWAKKARQGVDRLHRHRLDRAHLRLIANHAGPRRGCGLVFLRIHPHVCRAGGGRRRRRLRMAACTRAKPVVDLRVLKDRNFALGCVAIACFAMILYGSAVLIPQLAQQHLGYTAMLAGLVLSPGALAIIFLIPVIGLVMPRMQTRYFLTIGFFVLGCAMLFSRNMAPDIDFPHLVLLRASQSVGIGFLFVPASVLAYQTVPQRLQGDATALFTMFRNVAGSVGISVSTAADHLENSDAHGLSVEPLEPSRSEFPRDLVAGHRGHQGPRYGGRRCHPGGNGPAGKPLIAQAGMLAYMDVFLYCAILAFAFVPFTFLFSPVKASGGAGAGLMRARSIAGRRARSPVSAACKVGPNFVAAARADRLAAILPEPRPTAEAPSARPAGTGAGLVLVASIPRRTNLIGSKIGPPPAIWISRPRICALSRRVFRCNRPARRGCPV